MQLILDKLTKHELYFVLRLLNAVPLHFSDVDHSIYFPKLQRPIAKPDAFWFEREGDALRKKYEQGHVRPEMRAPDCLFADELQSRNIFAVIKAWTAARSPAISAVFEARKSPNSFVHAPCILGVPAHRPPVMINDPTDLVNWLVLRAFANRQMGRFVPCNLRGCGKFGLRERAKTGLGYCSEDCQKRFNIGRKKDPHFVSASGRHPTLRKATLLRFK